MLKTILKSEIQKKIEDCSICNTNISNMYTSCQHLYCEDCITTWLEQQHYTCPYCRNNIGVDDLMRIV